MFKKEYKVKGMSCQHCIEALLNNLSKLNLLKCEVTIGLVKVEFNGQETDEESIIKAIQESGYEVTFDSRL